ncbi:MAG: response regulator transcription factor [Candidatus Hydrogenedentes bacterium]|nr:response regulator transcription factor [Candidatus Hydrogenedentota bacterium]
MRKFRILVADDHEIVRKGIALILNETPDMEVCGEAATGMEVVESVQHQEWDAVVMDLRMPGLHGLELVKQVHALRPRLPILILTIEPEGIYARRLLHAGAAGYLTKDSLCTELVQAVRKICTGGRYVSSGLVEQIAFNLDSDVDRPLHEQLSDRELEVMRMLAAGMMPSAIAASLCISVKTVSTYRARILSKMSLKTNADLVKYGIREGLVS